MARKSAANLLSRQKGLQKPLSGRDDPVAIHSRLRAQERSWAAIGCDTSMSSLAVTSIIYDGVLDKIVGPYYSDRRWLGDDDYYMRLGQTAKAHELILDVLKGGTVPAQNVYIAIEEPVPYGMFKKAQSGYVKQQCEVAGAFKASLVRYGWTNIIEINNAQWRKTLRDEGVTITQGKDGKWDVKAWAIKAFGLPDFPDLVKGKTGGKVPRPSEGFGAKAKAEQPNDIYDAAAVCAWMLDNLPDGVNSP